MANVNQPSGLSPVGHLLGLNWNQKTQRYYIASTDTNAFAIGDPVKLSGTSDANGVPGITLATAGTGNPVLGAIVSMGGPQYGGVSADTANLNIIVIPATKTKAYYVDVVVDPYVLYEIQDDGSATLAVTDVSSNFNLVSGTNNGYVSGGTGGDATSRSVEGRKQICDPSDMLAGNFTGSTQARSCSGVGHVFGGVASNFQSL